MIHAVNDLAIRDAIWPDAFLDALPLLIVRLYFVEHPHGTITPAVQITHDVADSATRSEENATSSHYSLPTPSQRSKPAALLEKVSLLKPAGK